ncbi:molybdenum ABC transporter ATP-binding protein [Rubellicoccus peritrichatus]|uniref:Molybdenum ABC transporter ATP-binding protein n=1 Tax=Rubellicoccus peritrichatus TaxID=3080537 RepID=A0AAQ3LCZ8_9BACT|nr:molybdenum ABC transporter ATP-binding protein [Puniceicoccus sp. CR14]WOO39709.1 molybdenum ABC transporter ATP-binding protein [Puniceicoccus sp. CR14]
MSIEAKFLIKKGDFTLDVDLSVPSKGITTLFGPSGCGKTTLLRAIAGLDRHRGGFLKVGDLTWQNAESFIPPHQRSLGYVFQEASLFAHLTVRRNIEYGLKRVAKADQKVSLEQAIELLAIESLLERKPDSLSGGERQRVAIARALAVSPKLLLMDEPLASLDLERKREVLPYLDILHRELDIPMLYVSHDHNEVARVADHLVLMEKGRVVASGEISEMFTRLDLSLAHGNDTESIFEATVSNYDEKYHLTYLESSAGQFTVTGQELIVGTSVRLRIAARDVSLTLTRQSDSSIQNVFPATIDEITPEGVSQMTVCLNVGGIRMLARITRKSADALSLKSGMEVFAQVKSVALLN